MKTKKMYSIGSRHKNECYNAVICSTANSNAIAFLKVDGYRESLVYKESPEAEEIIISENTYFLSPHFAAGFLLRSEKTNGEWNLLATDVSSGKLTNSPTPLLIKEGCPKGGVVNLGVPTSYPANAGETLGAQSFIPFKTSGRPLSISSTEIPGGAIIVYEERTGKKTKIKISKVINSNFSNPVDVTDGSFNAYDPVCCVADNGKIYVAFSAFENGNYRIKVNEIKPDSLSVIKSHDISNQADACVFPSICTRNNGGIWFSYTCFDKPLQDDETVLKHSRFQAQRRFFITQGTVFAGAMIDGKTFAPLAPKDGKSFCGNVASMNVFGSSGAGHSKIIEDKFGRTHILFRHYSEEQPIIFDECNKKLNQPKNPGIRIAKHRYPNISIITLNDKLWGKPVCLIPKASFNAPISCACDLEKIKVSFTEDSRKVGGGHGGEWFDDESQIGVGIFEMPFLKCENGTYDLRPYVVHPLPGNSIKNPELKIKKTDDFIVAIGQTHAHTNISVCQRETDRNGHTNYRFMQDVQDCDFGCTTDHVYNMWHTEMLITRKLADYYYFPGEFVSFPAYEWTGSGGDCEHEGGPFGHVNPLFLQENDELDFFTPVDQQCKGSSLNNLRKEYEGKNIIAPPHHVADAQHPFNWDFFNPEFQPVIELFQDRRGSGEHPRAPGIANYLHRQDGQWALDQLKSGKRFGFIAGADHAGFARAGLLVKELTRAGLFEAFTNRRTFATTGIGLLFSFSCNGFPMGSELETESGKFNIKIIAPENISSIELIRNGEIHKTLSVDDFSFSYDFEINRKEKGEFWYCRILFNNGEIAWSSPIWLD